ncbi:hypothetical protein NC651_026846 [Populus alba x Populus x berolinensis]|nr:hypothetical protein NC651_026846 [Populus alba x Populus x berolinensis]
MKERLWSMIDDGGYGSFRRGCLMAVDMGGRKRWCGLVGEFDNEKEKHHIRCYYSMLVLLAICCWFVLGLVPSGQDPEAFCLVDVVLYFCFMESSLLRLLKLNASFYALFATVLGVAAICSLVCSMSSFLKGVLLVCFCCVAIFAIKELDGACSGGYFVTSVDAATSYSVRLLLGSSVIAWLWFGCWSYYAFQPWLMLSLKVVLLKATGGLELQIGYCFYCLFFRYFGENVGLLLSPCGEADFVVHRGASCYYAHLWYRLYFGTCVQILCCSRGYVCLLGLNKLAASDWSLNYTFCYRLCVPLVMLVFHSFC